MAVVELPDKERSPLLLRRNARAHVYELGDLDDFDWPSHPVVRLGARRSGWRSSCCSTRSRRCPVLLAIAEEPHGTMEELLRAVRDSLPSALYVHVTPPLLETLAERYAIEGAEPHLKLALGRTDLLAGHALRVDISAPADQDEIEAFYACGLSWHVVRAADARDRTVRRRSGSDGRLVCVAGVHVHSPTWGVAALGNVATLPGLRGQGLRAGCVCGALPASARRRDRDDRSQRPGRQRRGDRVVRAPRVRARGGRTSRRACVAR